MPRFRALRLAVVLVLVGVIAAPAVPASAAEWRSAGPRGGGISQVWQWLEGWLAAALPLNRIHRNEVPGDRLPTGERARPTGAGSESGGVTLKEGCRVDPNGACVPG